MALPFLSAEWRDLVVFNYRADPTVLLNYLPKGTQLESYNGETFVSIVAFCFNNNRFLGLLPTYPCVSFEEINLRFYVYRQTEKDIRRAVTFIKEVVPSRLIALTARVLYNEPYLAFATDHSKKVENHAETFEYGWKDNQNRYLLSATSSAEWQPLSAGSFEEFILEHYWGYTAQRDNSTVEYRVTHPRWRWKPAESYSISKNVVTFYGPEIQSTLLESPHSVFIAEGSPISVSFPARIIPEQAPH